MTERLRRGITGLLDVAPWVAESLVCPRDRRPVSAGVGDLVCPDGHRYPVLDGVPVMLLQEVRQTHWVADRALELAKAGSIEEHSTPPPNSAEIDPYSAEIDPFVQDAIGATNGLMYKSLVRGLKQYPIPRLDGPNASGRLFLEVGCNWGRWCIAASRAGYLPVGVDPSLDAIWAARRVARQLDVPASYVVADARYLPFDEKAMDCVFSYSVLQHLNEQDARQAVREMGRVLRVGGRVSVQMANTFGLRSLYHQMRRGFREPKEFEVRYWTPSDLKSTFRELVGPAELSADGFFTLNAQPADLRFLPRRYRLVVLASEALRKASEKIPALVWVADSLRVISRKMG